MLGCLFGLSMISESEWDTVIDFGRYWASKYLRKFPNWSFDEIVNEVVDLGPSLPELLSAT